MRVIVTLKIIKNNKMKKIYSGSGSSIVCPIHTKIICTLKELRFFVTKSLWNKNYRWPRNSIKKEFTDCFEPLSW
jgi:ribonuclease PH